jgi:glycosyltransferase involved in cell wall biosynthesis
VEQKGHVVLFQAARMLIQEKIPLEIVCVGDGPLRPQLETLIHEHGLINHVRLIGWQTEDEVLRWLIASRALVLPSLAEGLPVVMMESLAVARPVIGTYVAGVPELILPGINGWLVPAGDAKSLASAMRTALTTDATTLTAMGQRGQAIVRERHAAATSARKLATAIAGPAD